MADKDPINPKLVSCKQVLTGRAEAIILRRKLMREEKSLCV